MRRIHRWGRLAILIAPLLALPVPTLAGGFTRFGFVGGPGRGFGFHPGFGHGFGHQVVIVHRPPVFVPGLGGGPVRFFHDVTIVTPPPVFVQPLGPIWVPGQWFWTGSAWVWVPGHWR